DQSAVDLILLVHRHGHALPDEWPDLPVQIVEGDITLPYLGLSEAETNRLTRQINVVLHAAADTRFTASHETLRQTNVSGTDHLLAFARRCPHLHKFVQ